MSDVGATQASTQTNPQMFNTSEASNGAASDADVAEQLAADHGSENVAGAHQNMTLAMFHAALKNLIADDPSLSEPIKEMAYASIDNATAEGRASTTPEASDAVESSTLKESATDDLREMMKDIMLSIAAQNDEDSGAGSTEETAKKSNKGGGEEGGGNFLERIAEAMAKIQAKWIDKAEGHQKEMNTAAGKDDATEEFTMAQGKYSAAMQMFSMTAAATSTSIKSVGEGFAGIARKQ